LFVTDELGSLSYSLPPQNTYQYSERHDPGSAVVHNSFALTVVRSYSLTKVLNQRIRS